MHKFNICDPKSVGDHFYSDMFQWLIYHHHQGKRVHTESWDATGEVQSFLLCTHYQSHSTETDVHKPQPALYMHCESLLHTALTFSVTKLF
jgi:hypothetical protein